MHPRSIIANPAFPQCNSGSRYAIQHGCKEYYLVEAGSAHLVPGLLVANDIVFYTRVRIDFRLRHGLARLFPLHIFPSIKCGCIGQAHVSPTVHQIYLAPDNDRQTPRILGSCQGPVCISPSSLHRPSVNLCNSSCCYAGQMEGNERLHEPELVF